jgi:hypothetical protein
MALRAPPPALAAPPASSAVPALPLPAQESTAPPAKLASGAAVPPSPEAEAIPFSGGETSNARQATNQSETTPPPAADNTAPPPVDAPKPQIAEKALPTALGRCSETVVTQVVRRPYDNADPAAADFGSAIRYKNGGGQSFMDQNAGIDASMPGDKVRICLVALDRTCSGGRNGVYHAFNLRTGQDWEAPNSERGCGA